MPPSTTAATCALLLTSAAKTPPETPWATRTVLDIIAADEAPADRPRRYELLDSVSHPGASWLDLTPLGKLLRPRAILDPGLVEQDGLDLEVALRDRGWPEARVQSEAIEPLQWWACALDERWKTPIHFIEPGPLHRVDSLSVTGVDGLRGPLTAAVRRAMPRIGDPTSPALREASASQLSDLLAMHGYPQSEVRIVRVDDGSNPSATLEVSVVTGPASTHGRVVLVPEDPWDSPGAERIVGKRLPEGEDWNGKRVTRIARRLRARADIYDVSVGRTLRDDGHDVALSLETAAPQRLRFAGAPAEGGSFLSPRLLFDWDASSFGGPGIRLTGQHSAGWRIFEGPGGELFSKMSTGPTSLHRIDGEFSTSALSRWGLHVGIEGGVDAQRGNSRLHALAEAGPAWYVTHHLRLDGGWRSATWQYFAFPSQGAAFDAAFGPAAGSRGMLDQWVDHGVFGRLALDTRNAGDFGTRGTHLTMEAVPWARADARPWSRYEGRFMTLLPIGRERVVLVPRLAAGVHLIDDDDGTGLLSHRMGLGGVAWMRGFGVRRLGPPGSNADLNQVLVGGDVMLLASLEGRVRVHPDAWFMTFADLGRTWDALVDKRADDGTLLQRGVHLDDLEPTAGVGTMVRTPIGGLVAYTGVRLKPDAQLDGSYARVTLHVTVTPSF